MNKILIDCGAGRGKSIKELDDKYGKFDKIYAFECTPFYFTKLEAIDDNRIIKNKKAVWIKDCTIEFWTYEKRKSNSLFDRRINGGKKIDVEAIDFPAWLNKELSPEDYIVLKMDVEGAEYAILEAMIENKTIHWIDIILCEFHGRKIKELRQINRKVKQVLRDREIIILPWK